LHGSMVTDGARFTWEIKCSIVMEKAAFNKKQTVLNSKLKLHVRKKPVKCYIWSIAVCGAETVILQYSATFGV